MTEDIRRWDCPSPLVTKLRSSEVHSHSWHTSNQESVNLSGRGHVSMNPFPDIKGHLFLIPLIMGHKNSTTIFQERRPLIRRRSQIPKTQIFNWVQAFDSFSNTEVTPSMWVETPVSRNQRKLSFITHHRNNREAKRRSLRSKAINRVFVKHPIGVCGVKTVRILLTQVDRRLTIRKSGPES